MDVTKAPPVDPVIERSGPAASQQQPLNSAPASPALLDRVDIQPLDLIGALQILIAEVRAGLSLALVGSPTVGNFVPTATQAAAEAPQQLVQLFLQALPEDREPTALAEDTSAWAAASAQLEAALAAALDKGVETVAAWREVPQAVVDAVKDTRAAVITMLTESTSAEWLRPEWLGLAPRIERYRRRRRAARRRLSNPDHEPRDERRDERDERDR